MLVYPIPEVGWNVPKEMAARASISQHRSIYGWRIPQWIESRLLPGPKWASGTPITTSYAVYVERTRSTFDVLDSITSDHIIRIYPHKIFCDEREDGRCVTRDGNTIFYSDGHHLSAAGARLVTDEIMKEISHWDPKP